MNHPPPPKMGANCFSEEARCGANFPGVGWPLMCHTQMSCILRCVYGVFGDLYYFPSKIALKLIITKGYEGYLFVNRYVFLIPETYVMGIVGFTIF